MAELKQGVMAHPKEAELADYLKEVHGIEAAAGGAVMMAGPAAGAAAAAPAAEEKTSFNVVLKAGGEVENALVDFLQSQERAKALNTSAGCWRDGTTLLAAQYRFIPMAA